MDHIDEHLTTAALSADYPKAIKAALAIGKKTLNRYYNKTDHSKTFRIAMGMFFNLQYVKQLIDFILSFTSSTQARILRKGRMGGGLGDGGGGTCSYRV